MAKTPVGRGEATNENTVIKIQVRAKENVLNRSSHEYSCDMTPLIPLFPL